MAQIRWTDAVIGAAILRNHAPAPADRFANWTPSSDPIGEAANAQADGARYMATWRDDHAASFELRGIPVRKVLGVSPLDLAVRLRLHLLKGGQCAIDTEDAEDTTYETCGLAPGTVPTITLADPQLLEYTLSLAVIDLAAVPSIMSCYYKG